VVSRSSQGVPSVSPTVCPIVCYASLGGIATGGSGYLLLPKEFWCDINLIEMMTKLRGPGRPPNPYRSRTRPVTFAAEPKLYAYLQDLVKEQGYGTSRGEVARSLVWERVRELISAHLLDRRR